MTERNYTEVRPNNRADGHGPSAHVAQVAEHADLHIKSLLPADSPRLSGESEEHIRLLAGSSVELPPIIVHRPTMRVVDGMHRLRAALLRGENTIRARLIDGAIEAAFVVAVEANISHGLPLSLRDREAAAARIVAAHSHWSNRAIADVTGISARTVQVIRRSVTANEDPPGSRLGRDGRVRPVNGAEGRLRAGELFKRRPDASLREVAREAGISVGTAQDVRERIRSGEDPVLPTQRKDLKEPPAVPSQGAMRPQPAEYKGTPRDRVAILRTLRHDPTIRFTNHGRGLLRWLETHAVGTEGWTEVAAALPEHGSYIIADLATVVAEEWHDFADHLRRSLEGGVEQQA